jgi:cell wall-associated NlpC family hydrolase
VPATAEPGDFGLVPMSGRAGRLIRLGQLLDGDGFADYEHAFVYVGNDTIIEAEPGGARSAPLNYAGVLWSTGIINPTDAQRAAIVNAAQSYIGTPYSVLDYFAIAARRMHIPVPYLRAYIASTGHMICSQLVARCYADAGCPLFGDEWTGYDTPGDLWRVLQARR